MPRMFCDCKQIWFYNYKKGRGRILSITCLFIFLCFRLLLLFCNTKYHCCQPKFWPCLCYLYFLTASVRQYSLLLRRSSCTVGSIIHEVIPKLFELKLCQWEFVRVFLTLQFRYRYWNIYLLYAIYPLFSARFRHHILYCFEFLDLAGN